MPLPNPVDDTDFVPLPKPVDDTDFVPLPKPEDDADFVPLPEVVDVETPPKDTVIEFPPVVVYDPTVFKWPQDPTKL